MEERLVRAGPSTLRGRQELVRILVSLRRMSSEEAISWCDAWEEHAASRGMRSEAPYFWDSARGWIDAQLHIAPPANERATPSAATGTRTSRR
jgi:hypothetical protein